MTGKSTHPASSTSHWTVQRTSRAFCGKTRAAWTSSWSLQPHHPNAKAKPARRRVSQGQIKPQRRVCSHPNRLPSNNRAQSTWSFLKTWHPITWQPGKARHHRIEPHFTSLTRPCNHSPNTIKRKPKKSSRQAKLFKAKIKSATAQPRPFSNQSMHTPLKTIKTIRIAFLKISNSSHKPTNWKICRTLSKKALACNKEEALVANTSAKVSVVMVYSPSESCEHLIRILTNRHSSHNQHKGWLKQRKHRVTKSSPKLPFRTATSSFACQSSSNRARVAWSSKIPLRKMRHPRKRNTWWGRHRATRRKRRRTTRWGPLARTE